MVTYKITTIRIYVGLPYKVIAKTERLTELGQKWVCGSVVHSGKCLFKWEFMTTKKMP